MTDSDGDESLNELGGIMSHKKYYWMLNVFVRIAKYRALKSSFSTKNKVSGSIDKIFMMVEHVLYGCPIPKYFHKTFNNSCEEINE